MRRPRLACFSALPSFAPGRAASSARLLATSLLIALGCSHPTSIEPPRAAATLRIRNLGDFEWSVALEPVSGEAALTTPWTIPPRAERSFAVPAGEYRLRQTLRGDAGELSDAGKREPATVRLLGGRTYTWPLATLLTQPEEPAP